MHWIDLKDGKPDECERVLFVGNGGGYYIGEWREMFGEFYVPNHRQCFLKGKAWMRFPKYGEAK